MEPKLSHLVELRIVRAESFISNFSSLYVRPHDLINLTCSVRAPHPTSYVYWYKNKEVVHFDNLRGGGGGGEHSSSSLPRDGRERPKRAVGRPAVSAANQRQRQAAIHSNRQQPEEEGAGSGGRRDEPERGSAQEEAEVQWSRASSTLIIREAQLNDTANYTCLVSPRRVSRAALWRSQTSIARLSCT